MSKPLFKWAGGKTRLLPHLLAILPERVHAYYEPFLGGAAVFFALQREGRFERAHLSDKNPVLTSFYSVIRGAPAMFSSRLAALLPAYQENPEATFLAWRERFNRRDTDAITQAALFLALNKSCFNGLYRVNRYGRFNVPWGKEPVLSLPTAEEVEAAGRALLDVGIGNLDFEAATKDAAPGSLVYLDPPYVPASDTADFVGYAAGGFGLDEHKRVARVARELAHRGVQVVASNADVPLVRELYEGFTFTPLSVQRSISARAGSRVTVGEVILTSYPTKCARAV
jgi:DNA adenine methylase